MHRLLVTRRSQTRDAGPDSCAQILWSARNTSCASSSADSKFGGSDSHSEPCPGARARSRQTRFRCPHGPGVTALVWRGRDVRGGGSRQILDSIRQATQKGASRVDGPLFAHGESVGNESWFGHANSSRHSLVPFRSNDVLASVEYLQTAALSAFGPPGRNCRRFRQARAQVRALRKDISPGRWMSCSPPCLNGSIDVARAEEPSNYCDHQNSTATAMMAVS